MAPYPFAANFVKHHHGRAIHRTGGAPAVAHCLSLGRMDDLCSEFRESSEMLPCTYRPGVVSYPRSVKVSKSAPVQGTIRGFVFASRAD